MKPVGDVYANILSYLKKQKQANTFKLARELCMERSKLLNAVAELEERGAVAVKHGTVTFLHFARQGKKMLKKAGTKKQASFSLPKKKVQPKRLHLKRRA